ncbi:MAG: DR2241 family protein [Chthoniobacterales bacterium]
MAGTIPRRDAFSEQLAVLPNRMGEILIRRTASGEFDLRHRDDAERVDLTAQSDANAATEIARFDDAGKYRPLKTAPNLPHGWLLTLRNADEVRLALDFFYPGRIATFIAHENGNLQSTPMRETLERQTGIYRVAARISLPQADEMVARVCRSADGCLRTIQWSYDAAGAPASSLLPAEKFDPAHDQTGRREQCVPLLCQEACNLLVAEARNVVKAATE